ncbi:MAG: Sua5 YciO YrdC YwlC family protein [Campylobacterota bacterium]|nr:Sua5 YciO YrdC YwlC family protein [Campylobacterota bacterium]
MNSSLVYLTQTDTTVGFLSSDDIKLSKIKKRDLSQKILQVVDSFATLKNKTRVPNNQKNLVRRAKETTFIYSNGLSFRVVCKDSKHHKFIKKFKCLYSTSANLTKHNFDFDFAIANADVILYDSCGFDEQKSSTIYKINNKTIKKLR